MPALRLLAIVCSVLGTCAQAAQPVSYTAAYDLAIGMLRLGVMERELRVGADGSYGFESRMESSGLAALLRSERVTETSRGHLRAGRFVPERYEYTSARKKRSFALRFDHELGEVRRADAGDGWRAPLRGEVFDKLVYQAQLMLDVAAQPTLIEYAIADKDELKTYAIRNLGREEVETTSGRFATVKLRRDNPGSRRRTTVWCAEKLGWLPVKVEYRDKDGTVTAAVLRRFELL